VSTRKRQLHALACKAKVALEAVKERLTVTLIASTYQDHPQVGVWKRQLLEAARVAFARPHDPAAAAHAGPAEELFAKLWRLEMELEWLEKNGSPRFLMGY